MKEPFLHDNLYIRIYLNVSFIPRKGTTGNKGNVYLIVKNFINIKKPIGWQMLAELKTVQYIILLGTYYNQKLSKKEKIWGYL